MRREKKIAGWVTVIPFASRTPPFPAHLPPLLFPVVPFLSPEPHLALFAARRTSRPAPPLASQGLGSGKRPTPSAVPSRVSPALSFLSRCFDSPPALPAHPSWAPALASSSPAPTWALPALLPSPSAVLRTPLLATAPAGCRALWCSGCRSHSSLRSRWKSCRPDYCLSCPGFQDCWTAKQKTSSRYRSRRCSQV